MQFHLEMDAEGIANLIEHCGSRLTTGKFVQDRETIIRKSQNANSQYSLFNLLDNGIASANAKHTDAAQGASCDRSGAYC